MSAKPFEIMRWDSPREPDADFLARMMNREGLQPETIELAPGTRTAEKKQDQLLMVVLAAGQIQVSFPGYGVIGLDPGDILEIQPDVLHDFTVSSAQAAVLLQACKG